MRWQNKNHQTYFCQCLHNVKYIQHMCVCLLLVVTTSTSSLQKRMCVCELGSQLNCQIFAKTNQGQNRPTTSPEGSVNLSAQSSSSGCVMEWKQLLFSQKELTKQHNIQGRGVRVKQQRAHKNASKNLKIRFNLLRPKKRRRRKPKRQLLLFMIFLPLPCFTYVQG